MTKVLYAGSFDPVTLGHIDIIKQASNTFGSVVVGITNNTSKKSFLNIDTRIDLVKKSVASFNNVEVEGYEGLTVDFAKKIGATVLIRGLRNSADFDYEYSISEVNNSLSGINTVFFVPKPENIMISSSIVRELYLNKSDVSKFVPPHVKEYLENM